jgi:uracil-DNA glycosylase
MIPSNNILIKQVRGCTLCVPHLPLGPRPIFRFTPKARILIAGQAPGRKAHETGIAFNDPSGQRLRGWMGIGSEIFYDPEKIAILPMGFCYPGTGKSGDLPPRPECAEAWRNLLIAQIPDIQLTLVIGQYAQQWHLGESKKSNLTKTVEAWKEYWPDVLPLPHPSLRNNLWLKKNPWFENEVTPVLKRKISHILNL